MLASMKFYSHDEFGKRLNKERKRARKGETHTEAFGHFVLCDGRDVLEGVLGRNEGLESQQTNNALKARKVGRSILHLKS
jgi:hypothetical protein